MTKPARPAGSPAPWPALVLDSGGLSSLANNDRVARAALEMSVAAGVRVLLPAVVISESTRGDARDAPVNRVISKVEVVSIDEWIAREAARLKSETGMKGVKHTIDALVVAVAVALGGGGILTSDPRDIARLAGSRPNLRIKPLKV